MNIQQFKTLLSLMPQNATMALRLFTRDADTDGTGKINADLYLEKSKEIGLRIKDLRCEHDPNQGRSQILIQLKAIISPDSEESKIFEDTQPIVKLETIDTLRSHIEPPLPKCEVEFNRHRFDALQGDDVSKFLWLLQFAPPDAEVRFVLVPRLMTYGPLTLVDTKGEYDRAINMERITPVSIGIEESNVTWLQHATSGQHVVALEFFADFTDCEGQELPLSDVWLQLLGITDEEDRNGRRLSHFIIPSAPPTRHFDLICETND